MASEQTKYKRPASSPANKEEKKAKGDECQVCSNPATNDILECIWCEKRQHASCSKLSNEQCKVIANLNIPNIVFFCSSCIQVFPVALQCFNSHSVIDSKVSTLEKSVSKIQAAELKLNEIMKNVESQLEKQQKTITALLNDHKAALGTSTPSVVPPITEESVANIAVSINAEQKEKEKRQLNIIVHNLEESSASEGASRKGDDITKCSSLFQKYLGVTVTIQNAIRLGKRSDKSRLLKISLSSTQERANILRHKLKLRSRDNPDPVRNIFITPDFTPLEQKRNKVLRQQLADMNKAENVYTIKNGQIVRRTQ